MQQNESIAKLVCRGTKVNTPCHGQYGRVSIDLGYARNECDMCTVV